MNTIYANDVGLIKLGYQSENNRTEVIFDVSDLATEFPGGFVSVAVRRPTESAGHLVTSITQNGNIITWLVDDYELEFKGIGELQLIYTVPGVVAKTKIWSTSTDRSLTVTNSLPPDWQDVANTLLDAAAHVKAAVDSYDAMTAEAVTLEPGSEATAEIDHSVEAPVLKLGIPEGVKGEQGIQGEKGEKGDRGEKGEQGERGIQGPKGDQGEQGIQGIQGIQGPKGDTGNGIVSAILNADYTLTLTFTDGTSYTTGVIRGEKGNPGSSITGIERTAQSLGIDTYTVTLSDGGKYTFDINNRTSMILVQPDEPDDEYNLVWYDSDSDQEYEVPTSEELNAVASRVTDLENNKLDKAEGVTDVQVNGESVVENGVANVPVATGSVYGVARGYGQRGIALDSNGNIYPLTPSDANIKAGTNGYGIINASCQHKSTFYGLAKAAGDTTQSASTNPVGQYTEKAKDAICEMLGVEDRASAVIENTASGSIASFTDGAKDRPVDKLTIKMEPVQDLHGYDNPWPAGGGENKWPVPNMSFSLYSTSLNRSEYPEIYTAMEKLTPGASYRCGSTGTGENVLVAINLYYSDRTIAIRPTNMTGGEIPDLSDGTITLDVVQMQVGTATNVAKECQEIRVIETTTSNPAYVPYENICPITGWTAAKVRRTGSNLAPFDEICQTVSGTYNGISTQKTVNGYTFNGVSTASGTKYFGGFPNYSVRTFEVLAKKTYVISYMQTGGFHLQGNILDKNNKQINASKSTWITPSYSTDATTGRNYAVFVPDENGRIIFIVGVTLTQGMEYNGSISDIKLELASAPTAYEPYQGKTYDITLPTEAGTVYGGELTVNTDGSGTLNVNGLNVDVGNDSGWGMFQRKDSGCYFAKYIEANLPLFTGSERQLSIIHEKYSAGTINNPYDSIGNYAWAYSINKTSGYLRIGFSDEMGIDTIEKFDEWRANNAVQIYYPLRNPITYTLTAEQVTTLLGQNHIWSDAGDVEVQYRANTKLYIDNKFAELAALIANT